MDLKTNDIEFRFDDDANRLECFNAAGMMIWKAEARNAAVNRGTVGHHGAAPRGTYLLGTPRTKNAPAFGKWFVPLNDWNDHHAARDHGRVGLGVHGGGTGLPDPFAPEQGWVRTEGCVRLLNSALADFVQILRRCQQAGGNGYFTVSGAPGAPAEVDPEKINRPGAGGTQGVGVQQENNSAHLSSLPTAPAFLRFAFPPPFKAQPRWSL